MRCSRGGETGSMINDGILVLNKPQNWTSHDCVAVCRRALRLRGVKKIGHGGTLDPMAEGVLPIFIGQATRIMEYLELDYKQYTCEMQLGLTTDTQDIWGKVLEQSSWEGVTEAQILRELDGFRGIIEQMPPLYSAVRIDGRHLYEYARKGRKKTEKGPSEGPGQVGAEEDNGIDASILARVKPRKVYIDKLEVQSIDSAAGRIRFHVACSKGTYIRTICQDLGRRLGCGGTMTALTRTAIGDIDLSRSVSPDEIKNRYCREEGSVSGTGTGSDAGADSGSDQPLEELLIPADSVLTHFGKVMMAADRAHYFRQGNSIRLHQLQKVCDPGISEDPLKGEIPRNARGRRYDRIYRVYQKEDGLFLGTGYEDLEQGVLKADKVFKALNEPKKK